jgi:hypothetical protein
MSSMEGLDIRAPIGGLFTLLGVMLVGYDLLAGNDATATAAGQSTNVNLWWGVVLVVFGLIMLVLSRRVVRDAKHVTSPE